MYGYSCESYCKHFHIVSNKKLKKHTKGLRVLFICYNVLATKYQQLIDCLPTIVATVLVAPMS